MFSFCYESQLSPSPLKVPVVLYLEGVHACLLEGWPVVPEGGPGHWEAGRQESPPGMQGSFNVVCE